MCGRVSTHERNRSEHSARAHTQTHSFNSCRGGGSHTWIQGTIVNAPGSSLTPCSSRSSARAPAQRDRLRGARGADERQRGERERWRWGSGRDSCAWPCCPVSSSWIQSSGNTSKASLIPKRWALFHSLYLCTSWISCHLRQWHGHRGSERGTASPHAGASVADWSADRRRFTVKLLRVFRCPLMPPREPHSPRFYRFTCAQSACESSVAYNVPIVMVFGITGAPPVSGSPSAHCSQSSPVQPPPP